MNRRVAMVTPILTTKLYIPSLRRNLVPRQRLLERLDHGLHCKLTVVSAPAGFGKTTLLAEWIQSLPREGFPPKVAWISLDEGDNDPARFSAYLAAALERADGRFAPAAAEGFEWAGAPLQESHLIEVLNQVAALPETFVLVLDDYHLITSEAIHDAVAFLLDHLAENLHLVLATRADPPLPLARLRARGQLAELRQSDLRFSTEEAAAFLNHAVGLDLSAGDVAALEARTEGWIAGLQMASLALQRPSQGASTPSDVVQALTGSHRFVLDYLVEEVLEQQPPALQEFLLKTSILERLTGTLCDGVTGYQESRQPATAPDPLLPQFPDSQSILEYLESANLFIVPLDDERRWFRYHRLFADLLRKRLAQIFPHLLPALHRRAGAWHEQQGHVAEAIEHTLAGEDFPRAAHLVEEAAEATLMRSEVATFRRWVDRLPVESLRGHPSLCFFHAWSLLMSGRSLTAVEGALRDAGRLEEAAPDLEAMPGRMAAMRAYLMLFQADTGRAAEFCRQALECLPKTDLFLRSIVTWILSVTHLTDSDLQDGSRALQEVARMSQEIGNPLIAGAALCHQATLQMRQGRLHRAQHTLERALLLATDAHGRRLPIASKALIGLAKLELEWNDLDAAADHLAEGIELAGQWSELAAFDAFIAQMHLCLARGDLDGARQAVERSRQIARRSEATKMDDLAADLKQAYFAMTQGDLAGARRWAEDRGLLPGTSPEPRPRQAEGRDFVDARLEKYEQLMLARLLILQGQAAGALHVLQPLLATVLQLGRTDLTIQVQIQSALAFQQQDRHDRAVEALAEALALAEPGGYLRTFLDEGPPMASLLQRAASRGVAPDYARRLLAAFGQTLSPAPESIEAGAPHPSSSARPLVEPLTDRELEVLRLLAAGLSNPEIASELVVATSTVRSHCKNIYGKLDVHSRWDAVQRGHELGLLR
jgi:LuxR family transcriptional regulator, maltose regulon positive regulatory protein